MDLPTVNWHLKPRAAMALQRRLARKVVSRLTELLPAEPLVAGADVSYDKHSDQLFAAVVVLRLPELVFVEQATASERARFPYVPGLLSFREAPALLRCFRRLRVRPDVLLVDGHGVAHPRRFGIACHLGVLLNLPTIGCAKSILVGQHNPIGLHRGATAALVDDSETVGYTVRTRDRVQPVYVSVGHRIDLASAVSLVLRCAPRFRIPEPIRQAHLLVNQLRQQNRLATSLAARDFREASSTKRTKRL